MHKLLDIRIRREHGIYCVCSLVMLGSRKAWLEVEQTNDYHGLQTKLENNGYQLIDNEYGYSYYRTGVNN